MTTLSQLIPASGMVLKLSRGEGDSVNLSLQSEGSEPALASEPQGSSLPEPEHDASDLDHLIYSAMRQCELRTLGVESMSPNDPAIALSGGNAEAALEEAKKFVTNHIKFYRDRIEAAMSLGGGGFTGRKTRKPKVDAAAASADAQNELGVSANDGPTPSPEQIAAADKAKADKIATDNEAEAQAAAARKAKADDAKVTQAALAAKVKAAEELGFKW